MNRFTIVKREGSQVTILTEHNELWLTKRVKQKKDSTRRVKRFKSVRYIPIKRIPKEGDWLFTCAMEPRQFSHWEDLERETFETIGGAHHSKHGCSLNLITTKYAEFFIKHKLWELYEINYSQFDRYEEAVKLVCQAYKIKYEGI